MRLLIISCSKKKRSSLAPCRAIDLYDGPSYMIIRKIIREENLPRDLDIYIVSGKYGLIRSDEVIDDYDMTIDDKIVEKTRSREKMSELLDRGYEDVFVNMGNQYLGHFQHLLADAKKATGRIGQKNALMRKWIINT